MNCARLCFNLLYLNVQYHILFALLTEDHLIADFSQGLNIIKFLLLLLSNLSNSTTDVGGHEPEQKRRETEVTSLQKPGFS